MAERRSSRRQAVATGTEDHQLSTVGLQILPDLIPFVHERNQIWGQFGASTDLAKQLDQFARSVPSGAPQGSLRPLTRQNVLPTELAAALTELERRLASIQEIEKSIEDCQREISDIDSKQWVIKVGAIVTGLLVAVAIINAILSSLR